MNFFKRCEIIEEGYKNSPEIYRASKFWSERREIHLKGLKDFGYERFKHYANGDYFQFLPQGFRDQYFLRLLSLTPKRKLLKIFFTSRIKNCPLPIFKFSLWPFKRFIYRIYVCTMYEFIKNPPKILGLESLDPLNIVETVLEPDEGNSIKVWYDGKTLSQDIMSSALEFYSIDGVARITGKDCLTVGEIGAGYGRIGYLFHKVLSNKKLKYCIFDIPPALCVSETYLSRTLPELKVFRFREFKSFSEVEQEFNEAQICFFLPHQLELLPPKIFDLFIAVSNMPEMTPEIIKNYFKQIDRLTTGHFYNKQFWANFNYQDGFFMNYMDYPVLPNWKMALLRPTPDKQDFFEAVYKINQTER